MAEEQVQTEVPVKGEGEQVVTPWVAHAGAGQTIDYEKLISESLCNSICM